jgi:hypothetical protein
MVGKTFRYHPMSELTKSKFLREGQTVRVKTPPVGNAERAMVDVVTYTAARGRWDSPDEGDELIRVFTSDLVPFNPPRYNW